MTALGWLNLPASAAVHYVNASATGANNGTSWINAYRELQPAINDCAPGDEVWVATGIYFPDYQAGTGTHTGSRAQRIVLKSALAIHGGFAGTETARAQRNGAANRTILSGDIGQPGVFSDNTRTLMSGSSVTGVIIEGLVFAGGNADDPAELGGGIVGGSGGVAHLTSSAVEFRHCSFVGNYAVYGGAIDTEGAAGSDLSVVNCLFTGNTARYVGGAINFHSSSGQLAVRNCTIVNNSGERGAAIGTNNGPQCSYFNNLIHSNAATDPGYQKVETGSAATFVAENNVLEVALIPKGANNRVAAVPGLAQLPSSGPDGRWGTMDDVLSARLLSTSAARDFAAAARLAADTTDADGDGDTAEATPFDLLHAPRTQTGSPDAGAFETNSDVQLTFSPTTAPGGSRQESVWNEGGFRIQSPSMASMSASISGNLWPKNGTDILSFLANNGSSTAITRASGEAFDAKSVDLAEYSFVYPVPKSVSFVGVLAAGGEVSTTFTTDGVIDGDGGAADFQTFTFPSTFRHLSSLRIVSGIFAMDNLVVSPPAPTAITSTKIGSGKTSVAVSATVNANGLPTTAVFHYGTSQNFGSTALTTPVAGTKDTFVGGMLTGLSPHTTYFLKVVATNSAGVTEGETLSFTTLNTTPTVSASTHAAVTTGDTVTLTLPFALTDGDGDPVTVQLVGAVDGAPFTVGPLHDRNQVELTGATKPGTGSIYFAMSDGFGGNASALIEVVVTDNDPPTVSPVPLTRLVAGPTGFAEMPDLTAALMPKDNVVVKSVQQTPPPGTVLPLGVHAVVFVVSDPTGNQVTSETRVVVNIERTTLLASPIVMPGEAAPGSGATGGPPAGTVVGEVFTPAISDFRDLAARATLFVGRTRLGAIYVENGAGAASVPAFQGMPAPGIGGATFASFSDPLIAPGGAVAFTARAQGGGADATSDRGVWTTMFDGSLKLALRAGLPVPGLPDGAVVKSVNSLSLRDGELVASLTLAAGRNVATAADDAVLVRITSAGAATMLLREGRELPGLAFAKIKNFSVLSPAPGSPGHGRSHADGTVVAKVTLTDGRTLLVKLAPAGVLTRLLSTADPAWPVDVRGQWKSFGLPALDATGSRLVVAATLKPQAGLVTASDDAVLLAKNGAAPWTVFARKGTAAPISPAGPRYASFFDPVVNAAGQAAVLATFSGAGTDPRNNTALFSGRPGDLRLVARAGGATPDASGALTSATWKSILSFALPDESAGPVFIASLAGSGVNAGNDQGVWAVDSTGVLRRILRTGGDTLVGGVNRTVSSFTLLNALPPGLGATRSFNATGSIALLATFTDGTEALLRLDVP